MRQSQKNFRTVCICILAATLLYYVYIVTTYASTYHDDDVLGTGFGVFCLLFLALMETLSLLGIFSAINYFAFAPRKSALKTTVKIIVLIPSVIIFLYHLHMVLCYTFPAY